MPFNPSEYKDRAVTSLIDDLVDMDYSAISADWRGRTEWPLGTRVSGGLTPSPVEMPTTYLMPPDTRTVISREHPDVSIDDLTLDTYLGGSRQGWIWAARVMSTGRLVAVKILAGDYVQNAGLAAREAMICSKLRHPNIVRVFHVQPVSSYWVIIMELVQGDDLAKLRRSIDSQLISQLYRTSDCQFFGQIAGAVRAISQSLVVHRDLKPANIVLRAADELPVVIDFGFAIDLETPEWNRPGVAGTPLFMSPEAIFSGDAPDESWDAYSLGVTAAELLLDFSARSYRVDTVADLLDAKKSGAFDRALRNAIGQISNKVVREWCLDLTSPDAQVRTEAVTCASEWPRDNSGQKKAPIR